MGEIRFTLGDASRKQSISNNDLQSAWNKSKFGNNVNIQCIFTELNKNGGDDIDTGIDKYFLFEKTLKEIAGDNANISEDEANKWLINKGLRYKDDSGEWQGASAEDLFDFFNIAKGTKTPEEVEQQRQMQKQHAVKQQQVAKPPVQEPLVKQNKPNETKPEKPKMAFGNPTLGITGETMQNLFFAKSIRDNINMDLETNPEAKIANYSRTLSDRAKASSYMTSKTQEPLVPHDDKSISLGMYTNGNKDGLNSGVTLAGKYRTSNNSMFSGTAVYSTTTGNDSPSNLLNIQATEGMYFDVLGGVRTSVTGKFQNYNDNEANMQRAEGELTTNVPIPGNNKFFKGGNVRINGNISHSSTVKTANDITEQGSTTTVSGNLGANYTFDIPIYGDLTVGAYTSAFKMKDAGETQVAGGVHGPFGLEKTVGITPGYSGWSGLSIGHAVQAYPFIALDLVRGEEEVAMKKINEAPVIITATGVYNDSNFFGKNKNVTTERYVGAELNAYIKSNNSNVTITYGSQISGDIKDRAVNASYAQTFKGGNNLEFKVAGEAGYGWGNTIETDPHASNKGFRLGISGSISFAK